jgi:hypothetical protein
MINFSEDTPAWIVAWATWAYKVLLPEWNTTVKVVNKLEERDGAHASRGGEAEIFSANLEADICFSAALQDNDEGHVVILHEFCHVFIGRMANAAENLVTSKAVKQTGWKMYDDIEEETVVRLSRILVQWREGELNGITEKT